MTPLDRLSTALLTAPTSAANPAGLSVATLDTDTWVLSAGAVCPVAPGNAQQYVDEITGYILWGVLVLFTMGLLIGIGAILAGRIFGMPHASKAGVVSIVIIFVAGIGYLVLPGMVNGFMGTGCITARAATVSVDRVTSVMGVDGVGEGAVAPATVVDLPVAVPGPDRSVSSAIRPVLAAPLKDAGLA